MRTPFPPGCPCPEGQASGHPHPCRLLGVRGSRPALPGRGSRPHLTGSGVASSPYLVRRRVLTLPGRGSRPALPCPGSHPALPCPGSHPALPGPASSPRLTGSGGRVPPYQAGVYQEVNFSRITALLMDVGGFVPVPYSSS